jgi:hypothetical protein
MHDVGGVACLLHVISFVIQSEALVEEDEPVLNAGRCHALQIPGVEHARIVRRLIRIVGATAKQKFDRLVGQPGHIAGRFLFLCSDTSPPRHG